MFSEDAHVLIILRDDLLTIIIDIYVVVKHKRPYIIPMSIEKSNLWQRKSVYNPKLLFIIENKTNG